MSQISYEAVALGTALIGGESVEATWYPREGQVKLTTRGAFLGWISGLPTTRPQVLLAQIHREWAQEHHEVILATFVPRYLDARQKRTAEQQTIVRRTAGDS
jgi:hypothetical protein